MKRERRKLLQERIPIGVSSCLLGNQVRYNAGNKYDELIVETLGDYFDWIPVCPEFEMGLGVPREPMRLVRSGGKLRLLSTQTSKDLTDQATLYSQKKVKQLNTLGLRGFILKKSSPSCGMGKVKVYSTKGVPFNDGTGIFAGMLLGANPTLPIEEEGRLKNPALCENWIERVFAYHELRKLFDSSWNLGSLVEFHTKYKLVLLSHSEPGYRELGRIVATAKGKPKSELEFQYESKFMSTLSKLATKKSHTNVLQHIMGYFKQQLDAKTKHSILNAIEDYRLGLFPLSVPLTLLWHYVEIYEPVYLLNQKYFAPHPKELALRNHLKA